MNGREKVQAAQDAVARAMQANEQVRSALGEAVTWLVLAKEPDNDTNDDNTQEGS
ncbi:MAG TPA: hypothetical protein VEX15_18340 [Nocardioidaceae bacterium]|nr:hypothetical protein [Nocardioidaceae bacterium]